MSSIYKLWKKLSDSAYRKAFVESEINVGIPFQIRAMLKARRWTQTDLADRAKMKQPRISDLMRPGATKPNIRTLKRIADAFDCGLAVRFVPFSELTRWADSFDPESFNAKSFDDDRPPFSLGVASSKAADIKDSTATALIARTSNGLTSDAARFVSSPIGSDIPQAMPPGARSRTTDFMGAKR